MSDKNIFKILARWSAAVKFECELSAEISEKSQREQRGYAVKKALSENVDLRGSDLSGSDLSNSDLSGCDLSNSDLRDSNLRGSDLSGSDLHGSNLSGSNLTPIRADLFDVLVTARAEAPAFLAALKSGRVDGSVYRGDCACLVGTIANARGVDPNTLFCDPSRPIESFVMGIKKGDTPETNPICALVAEWTQLFIGE